MKQNFIDDKLDWGYHREYPDYEFSERGNVWDTVKHRYLKITYPINGVPTVGLRDRNGKHRTCNLAKVLLETFRGSRGPDYRVYFRDGDKHNINIDNLGWKFVDPDSKHKKHEWIPGRPDITLDEFYRNSYVKVRETGKTYDNIWDYIQETGEKEADAKKCLRDPNATTRKGHHIYAYKYDDGYEKINLEGNY